MTNYPEVYCQSCKSLMTFIGIENDIVNYKCLKCNKTKSSFPLGKIDTIKTLKP